MLDPLDGHGNFGLGRSTQVHTPDKRRDGGCRLLPEQAFSACAPLPQKGSGTLTQVVCVYYCSTYFKAVGVGPGRGIVVCVLMMIVLVLFLQKQNLANAIYLFGLGTLLFLTIVLSRVV